MEMSYDGTLVMPSSYAVMDEEEMTYVEGGAKSEIRGTAAQLAKEARNAMLAFGGGTLTATAITACAALTGIGLIAGGLVSGYGAFAANEFRCAYNYFESKSKTSKTRYKMVTTSLLGFLTGVSYGKVK